jgi:hypothetical protein
MSNKPTLYKRIIRFIVFHDWTWGVIFSFLAYWFTNWGPPSLGGVAMEYYAVNWIQAIIATAGVMSGLWSIARLGIWFNLRGFHRYIWGRKDQATGKTQYKDCSRDFRALLPWQRFALVSFFVSLFFVAAILIFLKFLSLANG